MFIIIKNILNMSNSSKKPGPVKPFVITVSSRALFDLEESHKIFEEQGMDAFADYQSKMENEPLEPGPALNL
jgi:5'-nucleotidase